MRGHFVHERIDQTVDKKSLSGTQVSCIWEPDRPNCVTLIRSHDGRFQGRRQQDHLSEAVETIESSRAPAANIQPNVYRFDLESPTAVCPFAFLAASLKQTGDQTAGGDSCVRLVASYFALSSLAVFTEDTCGDMV
jgi:hypothetical protein